MSVAPQSFEAARRPKSRKPAPTPLQSKDKQILSVVPSRNHECRVTKLPATRLAPVWLRELLVAQRGSDQLTFCLAAVMLTIYGWTVYTQQLWSKQYRQLDNLQRQERQLTATNEILKNQLAQEAENPQTGLVPPTPSNTLFLKRAPQRGTSKLTASALPERAPKTPLGY
ncbi:MAG: hypothetical protein NVS2B14_18100 [Chamaesiphon sp.]